MTNKSIPIAVFGMDRSTRQMLEILFRGPGKGNYVLVEQDQTAAASIFDLDNLQASQLWADYRKNHPNLPVIILSLAPKNIDHVLFVEKPIKVGNLLKTLVKLKELIENKTNVITKNEQEKPINYHHAKLQTEINLEEAEEKYHEFCGFVEDITPQDTDKLDRIYYDPNQYLQGYLEKAYALAEQTGKGGVFIEGLSEPIILIPEQNLALLGKNLNERTLRTMNSLPLSNSRRLHTHTVTDNEIKQHYLEQLEPQPLNNFLWKTSLWTARGRLPKETDLFKDIILLEWPNFTRLVVTPHALEISALWLSQPCSLLDTAKILNIPQRYVFTFFSAARTIKLALVDRQASHQAKIMTNDKSLLPHSEKRGLLQRLLSHLRS